MNPYDPQKAARVWQRVQDTQASPQEDNWPALVQDALGAAAAYQSLARQLPKQAQLLQRLSREARNSGACLRGICLLAQDSAPLLRVPAAPRERAETLLRKCYARAMNRAQAYSRRAGGGEYGPVLQRLADQEQEHGQRLLEVLGALGQ